MKKLLFSIVLLFIAPIALKAQTTFQRLYSASPSTQFNNIATTSDGGSIVCGSAGTTSTDYLVSKLDANGQVQWAKHIGSWMGNENGVKIGESVGGGYYLLGTTSSTSMNGEVNLISMDASGNILWNKTYSSGIYIMSPSVRQTISGGFIISAKTTDTTGNYSLLIKTDMLGNIIWSKAYSAMPWDKHQCYDVEESNEGGFISVGDNSYTGIYIIRTDANGNLIWAKKYSTPSLNHIPGFSIIKTSDGNYLISGTLYDAIATSYDPILMKINTSGNIVWAKRYSIEGNSTSTFTSVVETTDGGFAINYQLNIGGYFQELTKVNSSGTPQWSKHYTLSNNTFSNQNTIALTSNGGFLISSSHQDSTSYNFTGYLIKTDSLGNSGCSEVNDSITDTPIILNITSPSVTTNLGSSNTISFSSENIALQVSSNCADDVGISDSDEMNSNVLIFPNPFSISASIQLTNGNNSGQKHEFELYDVVGRAVKKIEFTGFKTEIKREELQSGIYLWRIFDNKNVIGKGKIVIE